MQAHKSKNIKGVILLLLELKEKPKVNKDVWRYHKSRQSLVNKLITVHKQGGEFRPYVLYLDGVITPVFYLASECVYWLNKNKYSYYLKREAYKGLCTAVTNRCLQRVKYRTPIKNTKSFGFFKKDNILAYVIPLDTDEEQQMFMSEIEYKWYKNFMERINNGIYD